MCISWLLVLSLLGQSNAVDLEQIVSSNERAVLVITGLRADNGATVQGSGVCISPDGYVLATAHQVQGVKNLQGRLKEGKSVALTAVESNPATETALLKAAEPLPFAVKVGDADTVKSGAPLVSIAAPMNLDFSTVPGTVSNPSRTYNGYPVMQVVLTASHGSSGGPVFDKNGALVGLISGQLEDVNFTIVNRINNFYPLLEKNRVFPAPSPAHEESEIAPAAGVTTTELRAVEAYNRGVHAGNAEEKMAAYHLAVQLLPQFYEAWFNLGVSAGLTGNAAAAEDAYAHAAQLRPEAVEIYRNLGRIRLRSQSMTAAMEAFKKAMELAPEEAQSYNDLGEAYRQSGQFEDAIKQFTAALQLKPDYPQAHYNLALACMKIGDKQTAITHFEEYLRCTPDARDAGEVRAWIDKLRSAEN